MDGKMPVETDASPSDSMTVFSAIFATVLTVILLTIVLAA